MFIKKYGMGKRTAVIVMAMAVLVTQGLCDVNVSAAENIPEKTEVAQTNKASQSETRYVDYFSKYKKSGFTGEEITIEASDGVTGEGLKQVKDLNGKDAVSTGEEGKASWTFTVGGTGMYAIEVEYYPLEGYSGSIERSVLIDNQIPFQEVSDAEFSRVFRDAEEGPSRSTDRPEQVEAPEWMKTYITDSNGYFGSAVYFYLEQGRHTLTLQSVKEPMAVAQIRLVSKDLTPESYDTTVKKQEGQGAKKVKGALKGGSLVIQAENAFRKSSPSLYASCDTSSTKNQPFDYTEKRMNVIGGLPWQYANQWISWQVEVSESGFYHIGLRSKQNFVRDIYCNRTLYIDGKIPFREAANNHFEFSDRWNVQLLGKDEESPYLFYLAKGKHTIRLQVTAGDLEEVLSEADDILSSLNKVNLRLVALMSVDPDVDRDYKIAKYNPEILDLLKKESDRLQKVHDQLIQKTGKRDSLTSELEQLISLTHDMSDQPDRISSLFKRFRDRVGSFGTWITKVREHPLLIDSLFIAEDGAALPETDDNWPTRLYAGLVSFINSFSTDGSVVSPLSNNQEAITVWLGTSALNAGSNAGGGGRDQAMALNQMIQRDFTAKTKIPVKLQLVPNNTILMATQAGRGPDVALQVKITEPVDFAVRNAVVNLKQFSDYEQTAKEFFPKAITPFEFNGGVYALPETMSFPMLFYRTDIMSDLGIDTNSLKTWDDVIKILPILQRQNMNFALPQTIQSYSMFLYQMNGGYYTDGGKASALNSKTALEAFKYWTDFYNVYSLPIVFSFENRFRTGEMPVGIAKYTTYNLLTISAPEIKGKWAMTQLPGIKTADGTINNTSPATSLGCILLDSCKHKNEAWEFMKWWTKTDTQYQFGQQMEAVMGASARYNTANIDAFNKLPWSAADRKGLAKQAAHLQGMPQVPGGYYTERNLNFAKLSVLNKKTDPRETLSDYSVNITEEIIYKRREFGLDTGK